MKYLFNAAIAMFSLSITGCNLYEPTKFTEERIQIHQEMVTHDIALSDADEGFIDGLAAHYSRHSGSPMDLILTYDPKSYRNTAMNATQHVAEITDDLRKHGVTNVKAGVMPIKGQGDDARLLVSYASLDARAPRGCDKLLPGLNSRLHEENREEYKMGCSIKTMTARQVSKPSHLAGRGNVDQATEGRSATNIVDVYRSGAPNSDLGGESATDE